MFYEEFLGAFSEGGSSQVLFGLALALFMGLLFSRFAKPLGLPAVTGYLIAGVLIGPYCLGRLGITGVFSNEETLKGTGAIVQDVALGFIAFAIGSEFKLSSLKKTGRQATIVGCAQAIVTMLVVDGALIGLHFWLGEEVLPLSVAITLGAIATATAPAATMMVVKQYKAKGPLTSLLLPVVALDDAVGLVCFAVSMGIAQALESGATAVGIVSLLINPLLEVTLSLALGALTGWLLSVVEDHFQSNSKRLCITITFVLLTVALAQMEFLHLPFGIEIAFSNLLVCMMMGTLFCNICDSADELMEKTDKWTMPVLILFFVFSGAELDLSIFGAPMIILIGVVYVLFRAIGKYIGAAASAQLAGCEPSIVKYLGITLFPQAGVALGMSAIAGALLADGYIVRNIVLFGVLVYELFGPLLTKIALTKAGDIVPKEEAHVHHTFAEAFADDADDEE